MAKHMDNGAFHRHLEEGTELGLVRTTVMSGASNGNSALYEASTSCNPHVCQSTRKRFKPPDLSTSPWHRSKSITLIVLIVLFMLWLIIYVVLTHLNIIK